MSDGLRDVTLYVSLRFNWPFKGPIRELKSIPGAVPSPPGPRPRTACFAAAPLKSYITASLAGQRVRLTERPTLEDRGTAASLGLGRSDSRANAERVPPHSKTTAPPPLLTGLTRGAAHGSPARCVTSSTVP